MELLDDLVGIVDTRRLGIQDATHFSGGWVILKGRHNRGTTEIEGFLVGKLIILGFGWIWGWFRYFDVFGCAVSVPYSSAYHQGCGSNQHLYSPQITVIIILPKIIKQIDPSWSIPPSHHPTIAPSQQFSSWQSSPQNQLVSPTPFGAVPRAVAPPWSGWRHGWRVGSSDHLRPHLRLLLDSWHLHALLVGFIH